MIYHQHRTETVEVNSLTIRLGDTIDIGGQAFTVEEMISLPGMTKHLTFATGETFTLHLATRLRATRVVQRAIHRPSRVHPRRPVPQPKNR